MEKILTTVKEVWVEATYKLEATHGQDLTNLQKCSRTVCHMDHDIVWREVFHGDINSFEEFINLSHDEFKIKNRMVSEAYENAYMKRLKLIRICR